MEIEGLVSYICNGVGFYGVMIEDYLALVLSLMCASIAYLSHWDRWELFAVMNFLGSNMKSA